MTLFPEMREVMRLGLEVVMYDTTKVCLAPPSEPGLQLTKAVPATEQITDRLRGVSGLPGKMVLFLSLSHFVIVKTAKFNQLDSLIIYFIELTTNG